MFPGGYFQQCRINFISEKLFYHVYGVIYRYQFLTSIIDYHINGVQLSKEDIFIQSKKISQRRRNLPNVGIY